VTERSTDTLERSLRWETSPDAKGVAIFFSLIAVAIVLGQVHRSELEGKDTVVAAAVGAVALVAAIGLGVAQAREVRRELAWIASAPGGLDATAYRDLLAERHAAASWRRSSPWCTTT
jgi:hypothetical protein